MSGTLAGKTALVTGGGRGIGRAFVLGLAGEGANVAVADLDGANATASAALAAERGVKAVGLAVDVSQRPSVQSMVDQARAQFGGIDILVNDAGVYPRAYLLDLDDATWDRTINTNLKGTFLCSQIAGRVMVEQGRGGRIVNMASRAAFASQVRGGHYSASKAGIVALTRAFATELAEHRITVNVISPGVTNTAMPRGGSSEERIFAMAEKIPLGRIAEPEDMVPTLLFVVSDAAGYVTGQTFHVNGGDMMR